MNITLAFDQFPGCENTKSLSREYWYCYLKRVASLSGHITGTCPTGASPNTGVVDKYIRVFGVTGIRVADASVIPLYITGNTNAACTLIGEKASDIIKEAHLTCLV